MTFQGVLMSHLHEHDKGIVKLVTVPGEEKFASAGLDGFVRVRLTGFILPAVRATS